MNSPELFELEFGQSSNFMTPTFIRFVRLSRNACAEISRGDGIDGDELWGVTTVCMKRDGTTRRGSPKSSQVFMSQVEAIDWCKRMRRILQRDVHPWGTRATRGPALVTDAIVEEHSYHFATGRPIKLHWIHNTEKAPYLGTTYQQDIEPSGFYCIHNPDPGELGKKWIKGVTELKNPLVLHFNLEEPNLYNETSWKAQLWAHYQEQGKALNHDLKRDGYDAVVSLYSELGHPWGTAEIVLLESPEMAAKKK
jgi:hypothetical protein